MDLFGAFGMGYNEIGKRRSSDGWLSGRQTLKELLVADNDFVLKQNLTHQDLVRPILEGMHTMLKLNVSKKIIIDPVRVNTSTGILEFSDFSSARAIVGDNLEGGWVGHELQAQGSFFNDQLFSSYGFKVTNLSTGKTLNTHSITIHMIYRYGFYQGGKFRTPPETLIDFFEK